MGFYQGNYPFAGNTWYVGSNAPVWGRRVDSIADAFNAMSPKDVLFLGPQQHREGNLVIPESLHNITLIGAGNAGACWIEPSDSGDEGLLVLANDVTLINVGIATYASVDYGLKIGGQTGSVARFRAIQCMFEGNSAVNPAACVQLHGCGDILFDACQICWGANGVIGRANDDGPPIQILLRNCWFHDFTTVHVGINSGDRFEALSLLDNTFDKNQDGSLPTDFILLSDNANTGVIAGNRFSNPTNAASVITIGTGLTYVTNATEAGWSTARPA